MIKALKTLARKEIFINMNKGIFKKPIANIVINGERLKAYPLRPGTRQECLLSPLLIQNGTGITWQSNYSRKRNKRHKMQKEEGKLSAHGWHVPTDKKISRNSIES